MLLRYGLLALAIGISTPVTAQWSTQAPTPTGLELRGVAAPTSEHVFVASTDNPFDNGGALFESLDGGETWTQRDVPFNLNDPINGLFFLDSQRGWAHGNRNYRTVDGGTTWEELPFLGSTYLMEFYTPNFGYASTNGQRWLSRDGGPTWDVDADSLTTFSFADDQLGLAGASVRVVDNGIYRTTDGGTTFGLVQPGVAPAVAFLSPTVAVGIVDDAFARSTDGGQTWISGAEAEGRNRLTALAGGVVLAWGRSGSFPNYDERLFRSADGGLTWTDLGELFDDGPARLTVIGDETVLAMDAQGDLSRSTDAGLTWTSVFDSPGPRPSFFGRLAPAFADTQTGYHALGEGYVVKTTDGGATWSQVSSGYGVTLQAIDRFDDGRLIAVGEQGTVVTSDGDAPWTLQEALTLRDLHGVQVIGPQEVVAVDDDGRVYRSADGGQTWTEGAATPTALMGRDLHFTSLLDGWVIGSGFTEGALFSTTDGGDSWTAVDQFGGSYTALDFEGQNGWAANSGGRYYRTTDGGATWLQGDLPNFPNQITDMDFADASTGYAVGWFGYAARSTDGGVTWEAMPVPPTEVNLTDLYLPSENEVWISTDDGFAYYSATSGQTWAVLEVDSSDDPSAYAIAASPAGDAWTVGWEGRIEHFDGPPDGPINQSPDARFSYSAAGLNIEFTDLSTDPDGTVEAWAWDFGDGTTSSEPSPVHSYATDGTYAVSLTVTDDGGETDTRTQNIAIQPFPGGTFGDFTEVTPLDPLFLTPQDEDFWVATTAPADYDGDGDLDIAVLGFYVVYNESVDYQLVLFRNDGPGGDRWAFTYVDVPLGDEFTVGASDLAWGDVDSDGDQDLIVGTNGMTTLLRNDEGTLVPTETALPPYAEDNLQADFDLQSITFADFDNDGDLDLLMPSVRDATTFEYRTALLRNDGPDDEGTLLFTEVDAGLAPTTHAQSMWADVDGDEDLDLLLVHLAPLTDDGFIRLYRNDGAGGFTSEEPLGGLSVEHGEAQWGDYDADGDYDILIAGHIKLAEGGFDNVLRIYRNDDGTFNPFEVIESPGAEGWFDLNAATWADYDSDGDIDILLAGTYNSGSQIDGRARIYTNDGGTFTASDSELPAPRSFGDRGGTFSWLDLDGEGDLDYFIAGWYYAPEGNGAAEAQMHLYRNDIPGQNAAPAPPSGLQSDVVSSDGGGGTVMLSWNAASDDTTPTNALTYDLDLRRNGEPVATPRRLPEPGDVSSATTWSLSGLADGTYTWSVRTVDSAFNGSTPAEATFTLGQGTPVEPEGALPTAYALEGNYPNPFHSATTIRFALPEQARVDLEVYDVLGRRVARLVEEVRPAGFHTVRWDAAGLASGTYVVRFATETFSTTQRIMLLR